MTEQICLDERVILQCRIAGPKNPVECAVIVRGKPTHQALLKLRDMLSIYIDYHVLPDGDHDEKAEPTPPTAEPENVGYPIRPENGSVLQEVV